MPRQLPRMILAELRKVLSRGSGVAGLGISVLVGIAPVLALYMLSDIQLQSGMQGNPVGQMLSYDAPTALGWALRARNFFVMPLILLMITAQLQAGEWSDRTLRSLVVRPVPRWSVMLAKASAAASYSAMTLLLTWVITLGSSIALFGYSERVMDVSLGFAATWLTDLGLIGIGLALSTVTTSVVGVVVGTVLFLMGDLVIRGLLKAVGFLAQEPWADSLSAVMPGRALSAWEGYSAGAVAGWDAWAFVGLGGLILVAYGLALLRFSRADIP